MSTRRRHDDQATLSQHERDLLKVLTPVLDGTRTQVEAARLLDLTPRHVRRLLQRVVRRQRDFSAFPRTSPRNNLSSIRCKCLAIAGRSSLVWGISSR